MEGRSYQTPPEPWRGYYITAYGLAVKHGFKGSEEEWLESLKGAPQEDVDELLRRIQDAEGNSTELRQSLDSITQRVQSVEESKEYLEKRQGQLETKVDSVTASVEKTVEDKVTGAVDKAKGELQVTTDAISQEVSSLKESEKRLEERTGKLETTAEGIDALVQKRVEDRVTQAVTDAKAEVKVTTDAISEELSSVRESAGRLEERTASLETTVNGLELDVDKTVEDKVNSAVQSATEHFEATLDGLSQKVTRTEEDAGKLEKRVGSLESTVEGFDAAVEKKVEDKVTGAVSEAKTELEGRIDGIEASVERKVTDSLTGTVEQAKAELSEEVRGLDASIDAKIESSVEDQVNGAVESATAGIQERIDGMEASIKASVTQTVTDSVNGTIEQATADWDMKAGEITQRVESLEETTGGLETKAAGIETKVDGIRLEVTQSSSEDGQTTARITLKVGPNSYSGYIKIDGNLDVSGQLSADALYASRGDVADLAVDRVSTSRRIVKYLAGDMTDDNFVRLHDQYLELVTGTTTGDTEQAVGPAGLPLYWEDDPGTERDTNGYPVKDGARVFITTSQSAWPVTVYVYEEAVKEKIGFELLEDPKLGQVYTPVNIFGAGNGNGRRQQARLIKWANGLELTYLSSAGKTMGLMADDAEGYMDLYGLRKTSALDFSGWDTGSFTETLDGEKVLRYQVERDGEGRPVRITDGDGHVTTIAW